MKHPHELRIPWKFNPLGEVETTIPVRTPLMQVGIHRSSRGVQRVAMQVGDLFVTLYADDAFTLADLLVDAAENLPPHVIRTPTETESESDTNHEQLPA